MNKLRIDMESNKYYTDLKQIIDIMDKTWKVGQLVKIVNNVRTNGLNPPWLGPYQITSVHNNKTLTVQLYNILNTHVPNLYCNNLG